MEVPEKSKVVRKEEASDTPAPPEPPKALTPIHLGDARSGELDRAWGELKDAPAMEIRGQTFTTKEVLKMGQAGLNYIGGMMDFMEAAGRITGMYKPEKVMVRKTQCPYCGASNPEEALFCNSCGAKILLEARFEVIRDSAEVRRDGAAEAPKATDR